MNEFVCPRCGEARDRDDATEAPCASCGVCAVCAPTAGGCGASEYCLECSNEDCCAECGTTGDLRRYHPTDDEDVVVLLCDSCVVRGEFAYARG